MSIAEERYREYIRMEPLKRIETMINNSEDTFEIMREVCAYGQQKFNSGSQDAISRMSNRPGDGDMGG